MGRERRAAQAGDRWGPYVLRRPLDGRAGAWWRVAREGPAGEWREAVAHRVAAEAVGGPARQVALRQAVRRAVALLHPHVARLQAAGAVDGDWVFAWDLAPGVSLARAVAARGPLAGRALVGVGAAVAGALAAAHGLTLDGLAAPLAHGALTPAAVRLGPDGVVRLTGWGGPWAVDPSACEADLRALGALLVTLAGGDPAAAPADAVAGCDARVPGLGAVVADCWGPTPPPASAVAAALRALDGAAGGAPLSAWAPGASEASPAGHPTRFVGRAEAIAVLSSAVLDGTAPVVCLAGPAGVGKTALAARVAAAVGELPGGVVWVSAAGCATAEALRSAAARALGVATAAVDAAVGARPPALWVVDGADACADACGPQVDRWAAVAPSARWLVTARTALPSALARVYPVGPLAPDEAMALFLACAAPWRPEDPADRAEVAEVCRAVDGLPLAIRVCAPAAGRLGLRAVRSRLSLAVRAEGRGAPAGRTRSARTSVAWAVSQLDDVALRALVALTTFAGGFGWAEAERVAGGPGELDGPLDRLAAAGLLDPDPAGAGLRLEPIVHELALARMTPGARAIAARRHAEALARFGTPEALRVGPPPAARLPDLEAALDHAVSAGDGRLGLLLLTALLAGAAGRGETDPALVRGDALRAALPAGPAADAVAARLAAARGSAVPAEVGVERPTPGASGRVDEGR